MKIYTKQGDKGQTALVDGTRISKSEIRLQCYGTVDELNSNLGLLISLLNKEAAITPFVDELTLIQGWLFQLGSQLACSDIELAKKLPNIQEQDINRLENSMDQWDQELPALKNFILPGGHLASAQAHICRTVTRRAERLCVVLDQNENLDYPALTFLNRLSDYFFVLARLINLRTGFDSPEWKS